MSEIYNAASRATTVTSNYGTPNLISSAKYNAFGVAVSDTLGNGLAETRTTAPRGWLQSLTVGPTGSASYNFNITSFAPDGDILAATDSANGSWTYAYDDFNRLISANATGQAYTYDYDRFGNRWHQNGPQSMMISFTGNNNRMDTYSYDAAGNLLNDGVHAYAYDGYGNLASVDAGSTANYYYDADGRRVQKNANGSVTNYIYNLEGEQIAEFDVSGNWIRGEMFAGGNHVATYYLGATYFNHSDWLGTERARTLAAGGSPCETTASLPFGDGQVEVGSCGAPSNRHFTGKERDLESGLDDFGARYYSSRVGRFVASDWSAIPAPIPYAKYSNPQTLNLYTIVAENPETFADLDGHQHEEDAEEEANADPEGEKDIERAEASLAAKQEAEQEASRAAFDARNPNGYDDPVTGICYAPKSQEPPQLSAGREAHRNEEVREGETPEVRTPSGTGRTDRYDETKSHIREIKPDSARGRKAGEKQLARYKKEMEDATGKPHTTELTPYVPKPNKPAPEPNPRIRPEIK